MNENEEKGVFLNGRKQVIDLLQFLPTEERNKLLKGMQIKNANLTKQLSEESLSFKDIDRLSDTQLIRIFQNINPTISGLALYLTSTTFQRRCLKLMDRESAQKAFTVLKKNLSGKADQCKNAQRKILEIAVKLSKKGIIAV